MAIQNSRIKSINIIHFADEVCAEHCPIVERQISSFKRGSKTRIMLDFSSLESIDSTILGLVLKLWLEIKRVGGRLLLFNPKRQPLMKLRNSNLYQLFPIEYEKRRAISRLSR